MDDIKADQAKAWWQESRQRERDRLERYNQENLLALREYLETILLLHDACS